MEKQKKPSGMDLSSEEIKQIQQALKEKGHELGSATGVMSAQTREAIREFQKANNLSATRSVDEEIAQKLGVSISGFAGTGASGAAPRSGVHALNEGVTSHRKSNTKTGGGEKK
jgi:peptidoglycan hydrolase-like protein with peptidoglycan-binding domain